VKRESLLGRPAVLAVVIMLVVSSAALMAHATDGQEARMTTGPQILKQAVTATATEPTHNPAGSQMLVARLTTVPTCDGYIDATEWADAYVYDISDTTGQHDGVPDPLGTVLLWLKQDDVGVYFAIRNNVDQTLDDYDQVGLYFDDDYDGCFSSSATTEGNHWVEYHATGILMTWRWIQDPDCGFPPSYVCTGDNFGSGYAWSPPCFGIGIGPTGVVDYEVMIPYGTVDEYLDLTMPPDSLGFFIYCSDEATGVYQGTWPSQGRGDTWKEPCYYGRLICEGGEDWPDHKMHYPQLPDPNGWDIVSTLGYAVNPGILTADDFMCTKSGPITDIHFWGSWVADEVAPILGFYLSIHDNIPGPPYSMPGAELWSAYVADFEVTLEGGGAEGWYDPNSGWWFHPDHSMYFRYDIDSIPEPFVQDSGTIYWLNVMADIGPPGYAGLPGWPLWGWKTSISPHFEDDAVWSLWTPPGYTWEPLEDPRTGVSLDMAFVITGGGCTPSIDVEKKVWDENLQEWVDSTDMDVCNNVDFQITILNDGTCDLTNIIAEDFMDSSLEFVDASPLPDTIYPIPGGTYLEWRSPGPLLAGGSMDITVIAHVLGPVCHLDSNFVFVHAAYEPQAVEVTDEDVAYVHATGEPWPDHKMHYPQLPDPNGWDIVATLGYDVHPGILCADDFLCTESGPITDIHFWGSWLYDVEAPIAGFFLSIHENIPGPPYSMPGAELWSTVVTDFDVTLEGQGAQGWYDPNIFWWEHPNHSLYFRYDIDSIPEPFVQDSGTIYWLSVMADIGPPGYEAIPGMPLWGWKTSISPHFEDDAVWSPWTPPGYAWQPLEDPRTGMTLDMAFVITSTAPSVLCGDVNNDGVVNVGDAIYILNYLFKHGPAPVPYLCVGDVNNDDVVNVGDAIYILNWLFKSGPAPDPNCCNPPWAAE
jgi:uncharacterized repeat protein (TIGR01451 family)